MRERPVANRPQDAILPYRTAPIAGYCVHSRYEYLLAGRSVRVSDAEEAARVHGHRGALSRVRHRDQHGDFPCPTRIPIAWWPSGRCRCSIPIKWTTFRCRTSSRGGMRTAPSKPWDPWSITPGISGRRKTDSRRTLVWCCDRISSGQWGALEPHAIAWAIAVPRASQN